VNVYKSVIHIIPIVHLFFVLGPRIPPTNDRNRMDCSALLHFTDGEQITPGAAFEDCTDGLVSMQGSNDTEALGVGNTVGARNTA
jgi:hypothetical protein